MFLNSGTGGTKQPERNNASVVIILMIDQIDSNKP